LTSRTCMYPLSRELPWAAEDASVCERRTGEISSLQKLTEKQAVARH
jgi:hypothetical protein